MDKDREIDRLKMVVKKLDDLIIEYDLWQIKASSLFLQCRRVAMAGKRWIESETARDDKDEIIKYISDTMEQVDEEMDGLLDKQLENWKARKCQNANP